MLALGAVSRLPRGDALLADAPDAVAALLEGGEQDPSTRRACFAFLGEHAPERAAAFLLAAGAGVAGWAEALQLAALELVRRRCRADPAKNKPRFLGTVLALLGSASPAVQYECATTLLALSRAPSAARAAGAALAGLLRSQQDNNVKLIVLGRLAELKRRHRDAVADLLMDVLAAGLGSADADVRGRTLALALDLISLRNVDGAVAVLKKEIVAAGSGGASSSSGSAGGGGSSSDEAQAAAAHRAELVRALHAAAARFPDVAGSVVPMLLDLLPDGGAPPPPLTAAALLAAASSSSSPLPGGALAPLPPAAASTALDVAAFAREIAATRPELRPEILRRVVDALPLLRAPRAACVALWMLGEFCEDPGSVAGALDALKAALGPLPIVPSGADGAAGGASDDGDGGGGGDENAAARAAAAAAAPSRPQVLPDGSYATQSAQLTAPAPAASGAKAAAGAGAGGGGGALAAAAALARGHSLRAFVLAGDPLVGPATSAALTKLVLRLAGAPGAAGSAALNRAAAEAMLAIAALLRAATTASFSGPSSGAGSGAASSSAASVDGGGVERMQACLRALAKGVAAAAEASKQGLDDVARPWLSSCRAALDAVVAASVAEATAAAAAVAAAATATAPDDPLDLSLLRGKGGGDDGALDGDDDEDLAAALAGSGDGSAESAAPASSDAVAALAAGAAAAPPPPRIVQLTGVGDPVYVEACLTTHAYDIALDVTLLNRTRKTLTNVALELATLGDLKLAERPRPVTLAPGGTARVRACVKVASTETGAIFGNVTFDAPAGGSGSSAAANGMEPPSTTVVRSLSSSFFLVFPVPFLPFFRVSGFSSPVKTHPFSSPKLSKLFKKNKKNGKTHQVTLADIHVDVMSFVSPAAIPDADFRERWASHEWENKIAVSFDSVAFSFVPFRFLSAVEVFRRREEEGKKKVTKTHSSSFSFSPLRNEGTSGRDRHPLGQGLPRPRRLRRPHEGPDPSRRPGRRLPLPRRQPLRPLALRGRRPVEPRRGGGSRREAGGGGADPVEDAGDGAVGGRRADPEAEGVERPRNRGRGRDRGPGAGGRGRGQVIRFGFFFLMQGEGKGEKGGERVSREKEKAERWD